MKIGNYLSALTIGTACTLFSTLPAFGATFNIAGGGIADGSNAVSDFSVLVGSIGNVNDVNFTITGLTAPELLDYEFYLRGPSGSIRLTLANALSGTTLTDTTFDDAAIDSITTASEPYTGIFKPSGSVGGLGSANITTLAGFNGTDPAGTWTLRIYDTFSGNGAGNLTGATLNITPAAIPFEFSPLAGMGFIGLTYYTKKRIQNQRSRSKEVS
jgi:hypothetical protein